MTTHSATAIAASQDATESISVLLIEDDLVDEMATLRAVARGALPYRMQVARSVAQARALLAGQTFDVILADYRLPDGTAFDLADVLAGQLVIFLSGDWNAEAAESALQLGMTDYLLVKDVDLKYLSLLQYRVETAMRQRRTERLLRASEARLQAILDNAPAAISARGSDGRLILSNRQHAQHAISAPAFVATRAPDDGPVETEETLTGGDGKERTYLTVRFPMPDVGGAGDAVGTISVDITERKLAEQQIRSLAFFDPLTGLPNRRMLLDRLQQAIATSERHGNFGAVFFIDLDHFKAINDTLGHDHGDLLLVEVAKRLLACVRSEDTVARIGGDEFLVMTVGLAPGANGAAAQAAAVGPQDSGRRGAAMPVGSARAPRDAEHWCEPVPRPGIAARRNHQARGPGDVPVQNRRS
jgi:GGDEF domain-containing protein/DNA-binding response OmpR family regulator